MATLKQVWLSADDTEHPSERAANIHDMVLVAEKEVDAWLDAQGPKHAQRYSKILKAWERERIEREFDSPQSVTESPQSPPQPVRATQLRHAHGAPYKAAQEPVSQRVEDYLEDFGVPTVDTKPDFGTLSTSGDDFANATVLRV